MSLWRQFRSPRSTAWSGWRAKLEGAGVWAAYGAIEALLVVYGGRFIFPDTFVPPHPAFTLVLLVIYPLAGMLLGPMAAPALVLLFLLNFATTPASLALLIPLTAGVIALAMRMNGWMVSLMLLAPLWIAREMLYGETRMVRGAAAIASIFAIAVVAFALRRSKASIPSPATLALSAAIMAGALAIVPPGPRIVPTLSVPSPAAAPNILLIVLDTVRADHMSLYGYQRRTTPHLDDFAEAATVYRRAYAPSNMTLSTMGSVFTGQFASEHGAHYDEGAAWGRALPDESLTLAEELAARGYATASIASNFAYFGDKFGLDQGFHHLDARPSRIPLGSQWNFYLRNGIGRLVESMIELPRRARLIPRPAEEITGLVLRYLDDGRPRNRTFFLTINYMDAHVPRIPPPPFDDRFEGRDPTESLDLADGLQGAMGKGNLEISGRQRAHLISQYDGAIAHVDDQLGRLFEELRTRGLYDETLIIVISDHGESFGEHGFIGHGSTNYDDQIRVPFVVKRPGQRTGTVIDEPVSLINAWAIMAEREADYPVISETFPMRGALASSPARRPGTALVDGRWKVIVGWNGNVELYDLATDSMERHNLAPSDRANEMATRVNDWRNAVEAAPRSAPAELDPETERRLRSLGYLQ
ncbi:MAG: sulfatase-like hydrolase/transferase [Acidobacteria bacterium]|nr:sulfatase-like hydrolase/transferase [Acidobacteriota bacterium]